MVIIPFGVCAPNLKGKPTSCYITYINRTLIVIDAGIGIRWSNIDVQDIDNIVIIITHLHCDHANGLANFPYYYIPTKVFIPYKGSKSKAIRKLMLSRFKFYNLDEDASFSIDDYNFSFCRTNHCIETYAVKIQNGNDVFIYTSDIESVDEKLSDFCQKAAVVIVDSGNPINKLHLNGYHGNTNEIVDKLKKSEVENIYLSHIKPQLLEYYNDIANKKGCNVINEENINVLSEFICNKINLEQKIAS